MPDAAGRGAREGSYSAYPPAGAHYDNAASGLTPEAACDIYGVISHTKRFVSVPRPSIVTETVSPAFIQTRVPFGFPRMTPAGVPV